MLTLDTVDYNYRVALINDQAALSADLCDFLKVINQAAKHEFNTLSSEALEQGDFSVGSIVMTFIRTVVACIKWAFSILGRVLKFLVYGYQPGFKRAEALINMISKKIPTLQQYTYNYSVSIKAMERLSFLITHHLEHTEVPGLGESIPSNKIAIIKKEYIKLFNNQQTKDGQIDDNFAMKNPPTTTSGRLYETGVRGRKDFMTIKETADEIRKTLSDKLKEIKSGQAFKIKQIMNQLQNKTFAMKFVKNKVNVTETLLFVFQSAVIGQDTKYLKTMENAFLKELNYYKKKAATVTHSEDTDEDTPAASRHESFID